MGLNRRAAKRDANEPEIIGGLEGCGWLVKQLSIPDWPDLIAFKAGRTVLIEVKDGKNEPSEGQRETAGVLMRYGVRIYLARELDGLLRSLGEIR